MHILIYISNKNIAMLMKTTAICTQCTYTNVEFIYILLKTKIKQNYLVCIVFLNEEDICMLYKVFVNFYALLKLLL